MWWLRQIRGHRDPVESVSLLECSDSPHQWEKAPTADAFRRAIALSRLLRQSLLSAANCLSSRSRVAPRANRTAVSFCRSALRQRQSGGVRARNQQHKACGAHENEQWLADVAVQLLTKRRQNDAVSLLEPPENAHVCVVEVSEGRRLCWERNEMSRARGGGSGALPSGLPVCPPGPYKLARSAVQHQECGDSSPTQHIRSEIVAPPRL